MLLRVTAIIAVLMLASCSMFSYSGTFKGGYYISPDEIFSIPYKLGGQFSDKVEDRSDPCGVAAVFSDSLANIFAVEVFDTKCSASSQLSGMDHKDYLDAYFRNGVAQHHGSISSVEYQDGNYYACQDIPGGSFLTETDFATGITRKLDAHQCELLFIQNDRVVRIVKQGDNPKMVILSIKKALRILK